MFEIFAKYAGIAGLGLGVLLVLFRAIIGKNATISQGHSYKLLTLVTVLVWVTAMTSIAAWAYMSSHQPAADAIKSPGFEERRYLASAIKVAGQKFETSYKTKNDLTNAQTTVNVLINFPQISGHPDVRIERKINELLKKATGVYNNHEDDLFDHVVTYNVISLEYDMLSVALEDNGAYVGAATSVTASATLNINLSTGEPFELKDLFRSGYQKPLLQLVKMKARCTSGGRLISEPEIRDNHPFYVRSGKLHIVYERREICPGVDGPVDVEIGLDLVKSVANPNGPINYIL